MASVLTIGGATVAVPGTVTLGTLVSFTRDGYPTLSFHARRPALPLNPTPYLGQEVTLTVNGTLVFKGDAYSSHPEWHDGLGWMVAYQCHGLAARLERIPHTDANTGTDTSAYNLDPEDPSYLPARAGRTVGQVLSDVLTMPDNGANLSSKGVGNLTFSGGVYSLPSATASDLAALTLIPPSACYFQGEKLWHALSGFVQENTRNFLLHIEPGGNIRILDVRTFTPHTFTMGTDPVSPTELSRDVGDCFPRVMVRGQPIAVMALLKTSDGTLQENFLWGSYATNAAAKAAWTPGQFHQPSAQDTGTCTCGDTLHVTVTSSNASYTWSSDFWDQTSTGRHGVINLQYSAATGVDMFWTARIVANTALAAGGTSVLTLDAPLPHLSFNKYTITGLTQTDGSIVYRKYRIANSALWPRVTSHSTFPQPFVNPGGGATLTSTPMGAVLWPISGTSPPYNMFPLQWNNYDGAGNLYFTEPTYVVAQNAQPTDVWALVPYFGNPNQAAAPANVGGVAQYSGTCHTVEGISDTLYLTAPGWRDPALATQMAAFAAEVLDAVKDTHLDGSVVYNGLYANALIPGMKVNVTGVDFTTGWESAALPVIECSLTWNPAGPTSWTTVLRCSNRRGYLNQAFFMRPARGFQPLGAESDPFGGMAGMLGGLPSYHTPGEYGVQEGGAIPLPMTPAEQKEAFAAQQQAERQTVERQRQLESAPARAEQEAAQRQRAMEAQIMEAMGPAGLPSRPKESPGESAMRNEQREALPAGGFVGPGRAVPADVADRAQAAHDDRLQAGRDRAAVMRRQREERAGQQRGEIAQRNQERVENPEAGREAAQAAQVQREEQGRQERAAAENQRAAREAREQQQRQEIARRNEAKDNDEGTA